MANQKNKLFGKLNYWKVKLLIFFTVVGPGIITGTADNDAGGVTTYSVAGAHYGYSMLWILLLITFMLFVTQEMGARLGVVTGKGLGDLIRERVGLKPAITVMILVFIVNFANILANVAGIASVADLYHIPRIIFVPIFVFIIWYVILKGSFNLVQNIFLTSCVVFFSYIINGFIAKPDMTAMVQGSFIPTIRFDREYIFIATALIGTTLTIWGQFFVQSFFVDKGIDKKHLSSARLDVFFGAFWTDFVAFFIIISAAATLYANGIRINTAADAALALAPLLGQFSTHLFAWGLLNASLLGVSVISMGTAYAITEILGTERKANSTFSDAPLFYYIIGFCLFASTILVFIPNFPMIFVLTASQALNTILLPFIFYILLKLINDKSLMGHYVNNKVSNAIAWLTIICFTAISFTMMYLMVF